MTNVVRAGRVYHFGTFAVDARTGELSQAGRRALLGLEPDRRFLSGPGWLAWSEGLGVQVPPSALAVAFRGGRTPRGKGGDTFNARTLARLAVRTLVGLGTVAIEHPCLAGVGGIGNSCLARLEGGVGRIGKLGLGNLGRADLGSLGFARVGRC